MSAIEYIVRPYQTPNSHGSIIIPATPLGTQQRATLTWGAKGTMPQAGQVNPVSVGVNCCVDDVDELSRSSEDVKIPIQDGQDFVTVSRAKTLKVTKKNSNSCSRSYNQQQDSGNQWIGGSVLDPSGLYGWYPQEQNQQDCGGTWNFKNA